MAAKHVRPYQPSTERVTVQQKHEPNHRAVRVSSKHLQRVKYRYE